MNAKLWLQVSIVMTGLGVCTAGSAQALDPYGDGEPAASAGSSATPAVPTDPPAECRPRCRSGYVCEAGQCISACNPACGLGERCTAQGECEAVPPPPNTLPYAATPAATYPPPSAAGAEPVPVERSEASRGGRVMFGLGVGLLQYRKLTMTTDESDAEGSTSTTNIGPQNAGSLVLGYAPSERVVLVAELRFAVQNRSVEGSGDADQSEVVLAPALHYVFPGAPAYLGARVGIDLISADAGSFSESDTLFEVSALLGAHAFVTDGVSIDPRLSVGYVAGSGTVESDDGFDSIDVSMSGLAVAIDVGVSAWF